MLEGVSGKSSNIAEVFLLHSSFSLPARCIICYFPLIARTHACTQTYAHAPIFIHHASVLHFDVT